MARSFTTTSDKVSIADNAALDVTAAVSLYAWIKTGAAGPHALISKAEGNAEAPNLNPYDLSIASSSTAPNLQAQGTTVANTTGSLTVTIPSHQADDILLLCLTIWVPNTLGVPVSAIPAPSGWTQISNQIGLGPATEETGWQAWFWKRAASGSETNPSCSRGASWDTGTDTCFGGRIYVIRGCVTTGDPWDATGQSGPHTAANQAFPAVTVSGSNRTVIIFGASSDDQSFAMTSSGWTTGTEDSDATGTDCNFQTARKENIGASTSADTATVSAPAAGGYSFTGISFKPPAGGGSDVLAFKRSNATVTGGATSAFTITSGTWTHLAVTDKNDGSANGMKLYKNVDTVENFTATSLVVSGNAKPVLIGERDTALGGNVAVAWAGLHNVELTPEEIREAKERGLTLRGLVAVWPVFGDGTEPDLSGNAFNGTVTGTSVVEGPPVTPPWHQPVQENVAAIKNELPGLTNEDFSGVPSMIRWSRPFIQFMKTAQQTGVTGREGFNLNALQPEGS